MNIIYLSLFIIFKPIFVIFLYFIHINTEYFINNLLYFIIIYDLNLLFFIL
jgi:hypothetical protein